MKGVNSQKAKNFTRNIAFGAKESHPRHKESRLTENVLVLSRRGSLGAVACGVFKALEQVGRKHLRNWCVVRV